MFSHRLETLDDSMSLRQMPQPQLLSHSFVPHTRGGGLGGGGGSAGGVGGGDRGGDGGAGGGLGGGCDGERMQHLQ